MRVFTIESGRVTPGATVVKFTLPGAGVAIDAVTVGESGRGRELGVLPVSGTPPRVPCPQRGTRTSEDGACRACGTPLPPRPPGDWAVVHPDDGTVPGPLPYAVVDATRAGRPKLTVAPAPTSDDSVIVVLRTGIGFRGGNSHTGEKSITPCPRRGQTLPAHAYECPDCRLRKPEAPEYAEWTHPDDGVVTTFAPFPGRILAQGRIAQGAAGAAGGGEQMVAVMPKGVVFRTGYSGRLYGGPAAHYYLWDGSRLLAATWDERQVSDVF